jgi:rhodanese-related sulfurtransferase
MNSVNNNISYLTGIVILAIMISSCGNRPNENATEQLKDQSKQLLQYLVENGDYINSSDAPAVITAASVFDRLEKNILIIDLRKPDQYFAGHIEGAVNVQPKELFDYFTKQIDAPSFEQIVLICGRGQLSAYLNGFVRLLGYNNTFSVRYGMSGWNAEFAKTGWNLVVSDTLDGKLEQTPQPKKAMGSLPAVIMQQAPPQWLLRERIQILMQQKADTFLISLKEVLENPDNFYIINYWPESSYLNPGHIAGSVHYEPRKAFRLEADLLTLPTDKPVVLYCYTGHHSAHAAAFLRVLGYDAYSLAYGANSFIHSHLSKTEQNQNHFWSAAQIHQYPLITSGLPKANEGGDNKPVKVDGGCI